jgi:uncharacterized protein YunC (DUF1805 family)
MEVEARGLVKGVENVGVSIPQSEGRAGAVAEGELQVEAGEDVGEDLGTVDGLGPGFEVREFDSIGLGIVGELGAAASNLGIEGANAQSEAFGFGEANAVVLDG